MCSYRAWGRCEEYSWEEEHHSHEIWTRTNMPGDKINDIAVSLSATAAATKIRSTSRLQALEWRVGAATKPL